jgi:photosystem II stability/assembly factor-like uncharacterized protein
MPFLSAAFRTSAGPVAATTLLLTLSAAAVAQTPAPVPHTPYHFRNVTIVAGGFISGILPSPSVRGLMYLRTDIGGAYRWDSAAQQWIPLTDWVPMDNSNMLGIESMALDPSDPNKLYVAAGTYSAAWAPNGSILRSNDQGRSFQVTAVPFKMGGNEDGRFAGERLAVDPAAPNILYMGTRHDGLWSSVDSGKSWSQVSSFPGKSTNGVGVVFVDFDKAAGQSPTQTLYVGVSTTDASLFRSRDGGKTWEPVPGSPTGMLPNHGVLASDGWLYLTYGDAPGPNGMKNGAVWKWNTRTGKWKNITPEVPGENKNPSFGYGGLAVDAAQPETILAATMDRWNGGDDIYRSTDGGSHWTGLRDSSLRDATLSPYLIEEDGKVGFGHWMGALAIDPFDPNHALYGTGATVWATHDLTQVDEKKSTHWAVGAKGMEETAVIQLTSPPKGPHLFSGLGDIGCFRNENFEVSPGGGAMRTPSFSNCNSMDFAASNPDLMVRTGGTWGGQAHGGFSADNGVSWRPFATEPPGADRGGQVAISADGSLILWATSKGVLGQSADHGKTWKMTDKAPQRAQVVADRVHAERFYIYDPENAKIFGGDGPQVDFHELTLNVPKDGRMVATPDRPDDLWFACRAGLWHADASNTVSPLTQIANVQEAYALGFGRAERDKGYPTLFLSGKVSGRLGIYRSTDEGAHWTQIDDDQHHYGWIGTVSGDPRVFGRVYLGTNGRGVIYGDVAK